MPTLFSHCDVPALLGGVPACPEGPPDWPGDWPDVREAVEQALHDGSWGRYCGPNFERLERCLAEFHGVSDVLLCASGTAAVELALRGARVGTGDEVLLAAYDFKANFQNVLTVGATPVLVDVDPVSWQLDVSKLEAGVSNRCKAIIASHLHGGLVAMDAVTEFAKRHGLTVIEDGCQCPGAFLNGRRAGTTGDAGVLSFGGSKTLTAGRGGAVVTNSAEIAQRIRLYTQRGNEAYPLSELQAAALLPQMLQLDERNDRRFDGARLLAAAFLDHELRPLCQWILPGATSDQRTRPGFYKLGLQYRPDVFGGLSRDQFAVALRAEGVAIDAGFRGLHCVHSKRRFRAADELHNASVADAGILVLHHPVLLEEAGTLSQVCSAVAKIQRCGSELARHFGQRL